MTNFSSRFFFFPLLIMAIVLLVRPAGLMGRDA